MDWYSLVTILPRAIGRFWVYKLRRIWPELNRSVMAWVGAGQDGADQPQRSPQLVQEMAQRMGHLVNAIVHWVHHLTPLKGAYLAPSRQRAMPSAIAELTLQSIAEGIITTNGEGQVQFLNPLAERLLGYCTQDVEGLPVTSILHFVDEETREPVENPFQQVLSRHQEVVSSGNRTLLISRDRCEIAVDGSAAPIYSETRELVGAVFIFRDVTQARHIARQLSWQASYDALTGLVNRHEFEQRLSQAVDDARTQQQSHTLCFLDLDRFKVVNDTCGHVAGDELLRQIGTVLQTSIRKTDTVARLGGDEFCILLYQCPLEQAMYLAQTICSTVDGFRFIWQGKSFSVGVSIGLVTISPDSPGIHTILNAADIACYTAKHNGRGRIHVYQTNDEEVARHRGEMQWVGQVNRALEQNRFCLHYQPIVPLQPGPHAVRFYEILVRLVDEQGNLVQPGVFIPAVERYNLMPVLDRWVISCLFATLAGGGDRPGRSMNDPCTGLYAINLSAGSVNDDTFLPFLTNQLAKYAIAPHQICFEITETVAITCLSRTMKLIQDLRALGCRVTLDDFGNGISSLTYLKNLPVDYLKLAGDLVTELEQDTTAHAIVEAISRVSRSMGICTIAACVANAAIREQVIALGIDYAQGYAIALPQPLTTPSLKALYAIAS